ncbi:phytoene desaturase family protein [Flavobacteriaceae bacterium F08102]|nr:phytoene desaturase family protein [Flavobacteriaceae bacterium F08102]
MRSTRDGMSQKKVCIIGSGFSSLSASCYLAKAGYEVTVIEKNSALGGRARQFKRDGFVYDMGPSFYWMPDVFEKFFNDFDTTTEDFYSLSKLNPAYQVYFGKEDSLRIGGSYEEIRETFEEVDPGSGKGLDRFMDNASDNYALAIEKLVYQPGQSVFEIISWKTIKNSFQFVQTIKQLVTKHVKHPKLRQILEFPVLFLGAKPETTPSFYNFMNHADLKLGTWYPQGGMVKVVEAMVDLAKLLGVTFITDTAIEEIVTLKDTVIGVKMKDRFLPADYVLSGADYHHTEQLLPTTLRQYSSSYWEKKTFAPSALLFFIGFDKKIKNIAHHTLFFDTDFNAHAAEIYDAKQWPKNPLFYASFPSVTDMYAAPIGKESAVLLIPLAVGLSDSKATRAHYFDQLIDRMEILTNQSLREDVLFYESYAIDDFKSDYNAYKGNAYGLANTLRQTHFLRPNIKSKKVNNLFFCGQLTVPGPGVPPAIISGKIASDLLIKYDTI